LADGRDELAPERLLAGGDTKTLTVSFGSVSTGVSARTVAARSTELNFVLERLLRIAFLSFVHCRPAAVVGQYLSVTNGRFRRLHRSRDSSDFFDAGRVRGTEEVQVLHRDHMSIAQRPCQCRFSGPLSNWTAI